MARFKLNPKFFNPNGTFKYSELFIRNLKELFSQNSSIWGLEYSDIVMIYTYGDNIEGNWDTQTNLEIYLYIPNVVVSDFHMKKLLNNLEDRMKKKNAVWERFNTEFYFVGEISWEEFQYDQYFDFKKNKIMKVKRSIIGKPKEKEIIVEQKKIETKEIEQEKPISPKTHVLIKKEITQKQSHKETIIAVPKTFEEAIEILGEEAGKIINYAKESVEIFAENTSNWIDEKLLGIKEKKEKEE